MENNETEPIIITGSMKIFALALVVLWTAALFNYGAQLGREKTKTIKANGTANVEISTITVKVRKKL